MDNYHNKNKKNQDKEPDQDAIMNRVNETFDRISQDVKSMIHNNNQYH